MMTIRDDIRIIDLIGGPPSVTPSDPQTTPSPSRVTDLTRSTRSVSAIAGTRSV